MKCTTFHMCRMSNMEVTVTKAEKWSVLWISRRGSYLRSLLLLKLSCLTCLCFMCWTHWIQVLFIVLFCKLFGVSSCHEHIYIGYVVHILGFWNLNFLEFCFGWGVLVIYSFGTVFLAKFYVSTFVGFWLILLQGLADPWRRSWLFWTLGGDERFIEHAVWATQKYKFKFTSGWLRLKVISKSFPYI